jgi:branched-chain amino acid transport system substrate-binding protein
MKLELLSIGLTMALTVLIAAHPARAATDVVIGDIDDLTGVYSDNSGVGGIEAIKMAIAEYGGSVLGRKIVLLSADHQNKADIGASKARSWSDQSGLNMLMSGANTAAAIAMAKVIAVRKTPYFVIGSGGASLTNEDCTAYTVHYVYNTTALANGTATAIVKSGGKTWFYLTADYTFGSQLQAAASKVVEANGGKNLGAVRVPLASSDFSSFLLQAQASGAQVLGLANAGDDFNNSLKSANEFGADADDETSGSLGAHRQHTQLRPHDRARAVPHGRMVLGPESRNSRLRPTVFRENEKVSLDDPGRVLLRNHDLPERRLRRRYHGRRQGHAGT